MTKAKDGEEVVFRQKNYTKSMELPALRSTVRSLQGEQLALKRKLHDVLAENEALKIEMERLQEQTLIDPLTKVKNRKGFEVSLAHEVEQLKLNDDDLRKGIVKSLGLLVIDADYFKTVNDRYGHEVGDEVLVAIAEGLKSSVRSYDVVCRWGGEEFVIILPRIDESDLLKVAEKMRIAVADINFEQIPNLQTSVSIGVAIQYHQSEEDLFTRADSAVLQAKKDGRNRIVFAGAINS